MGIAKRSLLAAATIAGASAIALGAGAGTASAACTGSSITGQGASLQTVAQGLWITGFGSVCPGVGVAYTQSSSLVALNRWGADGLGGSPLASNDEYIATDDAPTTTQIANIKTAAGGADLAVLADTQAAVAVIANVPSGCPVTSITNAVLEDIYRGNTRTWQNLPGGSGVAACNVSIRPVVRSDGSGTTFIFKNYLYRVNTAAVSGTNTWRDLSSAALNTTWPGSPIVPGGTGGGAVISAVAANASSIGYVNAADAFRAGSTRLAVQNRTLPSVTFANALDGSNNANCATASYTGLPTYSGRAINLDWSNALAVNPASGGTLYPICGLTFEVKLAGALPTGTGTSGYTTAGFTGGRAIATTVSAYGTYQLSAAGQSALAGRGYAALPRAVQTISDAVELEIW